MEEIIEQAEEVGNHQDAYGQWVIKGLTIGGENTEEEAITLYEEAKREPTEAEKEKAQKEYKTTQYQRDRANIYPLIEEQLDMQYWDDVNGTTVWKDTIEAIKAKYPKPVEA